MKKILSTLLALMILVSVLSGCKEPEPTDYTQTLSGKTAAQLLLAEHRLNETVLQNDGDIFDSGVEAMNTLAERAVTNLKATTPSGYRVKVKHAQSRADLSDNTPLVTLDREGSFAEEKAGIGTMQVVGDSVIWSDFSEVSNSYEYFLNLTNNIVLTAEIAADTIDFVKKNLRVVGKWVAFGQYQYYLSVTQNSELMVCHDTHNNMLDIVTRHRNEDGRDVYELYRDNGLGYIQRMSYIADEKYELSLNDLYFVANNTKGYWETYVVGEAPDHYNVSYLIMKDDICYTFNGGEDTLDFTPVTILSADRQTDIMKIDAVGGNVYVDLHLCAFDGVASIRAPKQEATFGPQGDFAVVSGSRNVVVELQNGMSITSSTHFAEGAVTVNDLRVGSYAYGYASEMGLRITADSYDEALVYLRAFLSEYDLRCRRDLDTVLAGVTRTQTDIRDIQRYFTWNGVVVCSNAAITEAIAVEDARFAAMRAHFEALADVPVIDARDLEVLTLHASFPTVTASTLAGVEVRGTSLSARTLSLTIEDTLLCVEDEPYTVHLALADANGGLIHLQQQADGTVAYDGSPVFTVTVNNAALTLPHLPVGEYTLVAYIATADGIRSSAYVPVDALVTNPGVDLGDVIFTAASREGRLVCTYTKPSELHLTLASDETLHYTAFADLVGAAVFAYGSPSQVIERLDNGVYVPLGAEETAIADGTYRVAYTRTDGTTTDSGYAIIAYTSAK